MSTIVLDTQSVHIPPGIDSLASFRRWVHSDDFPETGRITVVRVEEQLSGWYRLLRREEAGRIRRLTMPEQFGGLPEQTTSFRLRFSQRRVRLPDKASSPNKANAATLPAEAEVGSQLIFP